MIVTIYFCQVCQDPFSGSAGKGGRELCEQHRHLAGATRLELMRCIHELECKLDQQDADAAAASKVAS